VAIDDERLHARLLCREISWSPTTITDNEPAPRTNITALGRVGESPWFAIHPPATIGRALLHPWCLPSPAIDRASEANSPELRQNRAGRTSAEAQSKAKPTVMEDTS
jgi:hypothetical protein